MEHNKEDDTKKAPKKAEGASHAQKRVVVTYGMKPKKEDNPDVPAEILPHDDVVVVESPIEKPVPITGTLGNVSTTLKGHIHREDLEHASVAQDIPPSPPPPPSPAEASPSFGSEEKSVEKTKSASSFSANFAMFLSMITSLGLMGYAHYSQTQLVDFQEQNESDKVAVSALLVDVKRSIGELEAIRAAVLKEKQGLTTLQQQLEHLQERFVILKGNRDWVLSEVDYLVSMANERLAAAKDISTAVAQLKTATERLSNLNDPSLSYLKTAIMGDIKTLMSVTQIDKHGLWVEVGSLSELISKLQFKALGIEKHPNEQTEDNHKFNISSWQDGLHQSWDEIKSLVKITRIEENPIPVAFTQQEQSQLLQILQLLSEQAQWAVLQSDSKIYVDSLSKLERYVKSYFIENEDQTALINRIKTLEHQPLSFPLPTISDSLKALSQALASKKES